MLIVVFVALFTLAVLGAPPAHAGTWRPLKPGEAHAPTREVGYGQIRYLGHGPEYWWNVAHERQLELRIRWRPTVEYALRLSAAAYGVSLWQLRSVSWCESSFNVFARNGVHRSLFQEGPMFESGPFGRAGFSVWDPVANALTAAYTVAREGWRQWQCKP